MNPIAASGLVSARRMSLPSSGYHASHTTPDTHPMRLLDPKAITSSNACLQ